MNESRETKKCVGSVKDTKNKSPFGQYTEYLRGGNEGKGLTLGRLTYTQEDLFPDHGFLVSRWVDHHYFLPSIILYIYYPIGKHLFLYWFFPIIKHWGIFWYMSICTHLHCFLKVPRWFSGKESACQRRGHRRHGFNIWVGKIPWRRKWQPTPVFLLGKSHGQKSLMGYSP